MICYHRVIKNKGSCMMKTIEERTAELKQVIKDTKASIQANTVDFGDSASVKRFEKHIETVFRERINLIKSYENRGTESGFTYAGVNRRIGAITRYVKDVYYSNTEIYPRLNIAHAIADLCAPCPSASFDSLDERYHIELAAALWILDQLRNSKRLDEALEFLPESREELDKVSMPDITDSVHSDDLIRGMLYVIRYRNAEQSGFDESKVFMDGADASRTEASADENTAGRKRFNGIMNLIDSAVKREVCDRFTAQIHELTANLLLILSRLNDTKIALTETKIRMIEDEIQRVTNSAVQHDAGFETTYTVMSDKQNVALQIEEQIRQMDYRIQTFCQSIAILRPERRDEICELIGEELFAQIKTPDVRHPFEHCFAFLRLLDSGSDLVWLYNPPYLLLMNACLELPWAGTDSTQNKTPQFSAALYDAAKHHPHDYITPPENSVLNQRIVDQPFVNPCRDKISFSQLVYVISGIVPPRGLPEMSYLKALLKDSGKSPSEIDSLYEYLSLAYLLSQRDENYVFIDDSEDTEEPDPTTDNDDKAQKLRELKRENKNLKAMINKLEHRLRESGEALKNADESLNEATAELAELRTMIRSAEEDKTDYSTTISFPYEAQKRAVVFGGHSSWSKAIRPLLPNVRFIEPSALPNTGLIMNADVVWIQTNALSHSSFYKIIDVVRKHNIKLHYFKYASAEKCAEQFALEDMGDTEE